MKFSPLIFLLCCQNPNKIQYISHNAPVEIVCLNCPDTSDIVSPATGKHWPCNYFDTFVMVGTNP